MSSFRDLSIIVLDTSRTCIRAGHGIHDLLRTPSVEFPARVGLRKSSNEDPSVAPNNGDVSFTSAFPTTKSASVNDYLVGSQLDEALASGQDITVYWPFASGSIDDSTQAEAIWKYALFNQLGLRRVTMESPVLLTIFPGQSRDTYERIGRIFFERFNVAGFSILDRPMAQFYAAIGTNNDLSGVIVDIGEHNVDISPVHDGFPIHAARTTVGYGSTDCEYYLANLLRTQNPSLISTLSPPENPLSPETLQSTLVELARQVWREGHVKVLAEGEVADLEEEGITDIAAVLVAGKEKAVIETGMKKKATQKASAAEQARAKEIEAMDLVTLQFRDKEVTLGKERHRFCEPLFDPTLLDGVPGLPSRDQDDEAKRPIHVSLGHAVGMTEVDVRQYIWQGLFITGEVTSKIKGLGTALQARLSPFILGVPDQLNEVQPKTTRVLKIPEYYAEYRDQGDHLASFLGASVIAKITFNDSIGKNFVSKSDYSSRGPKAILDMSPSLL